MAGMRRIVLIAFASLITGIGRVDATSTTNFSDQWWNPNESGWGASFLQQGDIIFIDLFVYGTDTKPTWFTVAARYQSTTAQGHIIFSGALSVTSGPPFAGTFSPNSVTLREVGTLTFEATDVDNGTLTYTVDGTLVTKSVTRQLWKYENFTGNYYGGLIYDLTQCANPANNGHIEELGTVNINHSANNTITVATQTATATASGSCNYTGTYTQAGHMGTMQGSYTCTNGISGTFVAFEMEKTISGMTGRFVGSNTFCQISGHFGGLLR